MMVAEIKSALIRDHVVGNSARKDDILHVEQRLKESIDRSEERLKAKIVALELRMTIRLGSLIAAGVALIAALQALL